MTGRINEGKVYFNVSLNFRPPQASVFRGRCVGLVVARLPHDQGIVGSNPAAIPDVSFSF